jgi:hypothetical protein
MGTYGVYEKSEDGKKEKTRGSGQISRYQETKDGGWYKPYRNANTIYKVRH